MQKKEMLRIARYVLTCCGAEDTSDMQASQDHFKANDTVMLAEERKENPAQTDSLKPLKQETPCCLADDLEANTRRKQSHRRTKRNTHSIDKKPRRAKQGLTYPQELTIPDIPNAETTQKEASNTTLQQVDSLQEQEIPVKKTNPVPLKGILKNKTKVNSFIPVLMPRAMGRRKRNF
jgi:hypothetical protein